MSVSWDRNTSAPQQLIADRNLYLDKSGSTVVEEGSSESASQLVAAGHPINQADADRLGLVMNGDRVEQDRSVKIEELQALVDELAAELDAFNEKAEQYRTENATKDIPNTMEAARVALVTRHEHAVLALGQFKKAADGKDPHKGESQATALKPETSEVAREATAAANEAVAASPSPRELAANAPTAPAEVAPQHPATESSTATRESAVPSDKPAAKKSTSKSTSKRTRGK